jgi:hypothetical protein
MVELRPLNAGEAFDVALAIYRGAARSLFALAAALLLPFGVLQFLVILSLVPDSGHDVSAGAVWAAILSLTIILLATTSALAALSTHLVVQRRLYEQRVTARESARHALHRSGFIAVALIVALLSTVGYFLCVLPGMAIWVTWSLAGPAYVSEPIGVGRALGRSSHLLRRGWWRAFGIYLGSLIAWGGVLYVVFLAALILAGIANAGPVAITLVSTIGTVVSLVLLAPVLAVNAIVLYSDGRVRQDALDVAMAIAAARASDAAPAPSAAALAGAAATPTLPFGAPPAVAPPPPPVPWGER